MNYIDYFKNGSKIHIKKKNKGKFTDYCGGKVTEECIQKGKHSPSAAIRKRATFAANARTWKHQTGGRVYFNAEENEDKKKYNIVDPRKGEQQDQVSQTKEQQDTTTQTDWISQLIQSLNIPDQTQSSSQSTSVPSSSVSADASNRMKTAVNYLISKGFSRAGAAGAAGVFFTESGLTPGIVNKDEEKKYGGNAGKGIAQWSNERRSGYDAYMKDKQGTLEDELDYFIQEVAESRPKVLQVLKSTSDVNEAVQAMHLGYENGNSNAFATPEQLTAAYSRAWEKLGYGKYDYQASHNKRLGYAQTAYNLV